MSATSIAFGLLIFGFAILLLHWMHNKTETGESQSQRICPFCGLITSLSWLSVKWRIDVLR